MKGLNSGTHLKKIRTENEDDYKEVWLKLKKTDAYKAGSKERYRIDCKFGEGKLWLGALPLSCNSPIYRSILHNLYWFEP